MTRDRRRSPGPQPEGCGFSVSTTSAVRRRPRCPVGTIDPPRSPLTARRGRFPRETHRMTTETLPNGVNATAVVDFARQLLDEPPAGGTPFRAEVRWRGGFRNEIPCSRPATDLRRRARDPRRHRHRRQSGRAGPRRAGSLPRHRLHRGGRGPRDHHRRPAHRARREHRPAGLLRARGRPRRVSAVDARVYLRSDAPVEAIEALHADVVRTSPVGNTLERPAAVHIGLVTVQAA